MPELVLIQDHASVVWAALSRFAARGETNKPSAQRLLLARP